MATRYLGLGTLLHVDKDDDAGYDSFDLIVNGTPPSREREEVDCTVLADTLQIYAAGIEKHSKYSVRFKWDSADTVHAALLTLFAAKTTTLWKITFTSASSNVWTFEGWIQQLNLQQIEHNKHYECEVVVNRTSAITIA